MRWTSIVAIYLLLWVAFAFMLLPFSFAKTDEEAGNELVPGQTESAPHGFDFRRHMLRAAIVAAIATFLYDINYIYGWITTDDLDLYRRLSGS